MRVAPSFLVLLVFAVAGAQATERLTIAVASNFQAAASEIATRFSDATDIQVNVSSGSTGSLYARIVNGAPYDIFLAADQERPQLLLESGHAVDDTMFVYASGHLVLWSTDARYLEQPCRKALRSGDFSRLSIANPRTAPYGLAARSYLQSEGLWPAVKDKLVLGESVSQAFQFVATGNASLGLIASSQVPIELAKSASCFEPIGDTEGGDRLVHQAAVILAASKNRNAALRFTAFLRSAEVVELLQRRGYATQLAGP